MSGEQTRAALDQLEQAKRVLSQTRFDPTLRQILAELFGKERADIAALQAMDAAAEAIKSLEAEASALSADLEMLKHARASNDHVAGAFVESMVDTTRDTAR